MNGVLRLGFESGCGKRGHRAGKEGTGRREREENKRQIFLIDGLFKIILFLPFSFIIYGPK